MNNITQEEITNMENKIEEYEYKATVLEISSFYVNQYLVSLKNDNVANYITYTDILRKHEEDQITLIDEAYHDCLMIINHLQSSKEVKDYLELIKEQDVKDYKEYHRLIGSYKYRINCIKKQQTNKKLIKMMTV